MPSVYPGSLDSFAISHQTGEVILSQTDNDLADAVNKLEAELGVGPSGSFADIKSRLLDLSLDIREFGENIGQVGVDATAAFQAVCDEADARKPAGTFGGPPVRIPPGDYDISSTVTPRRHDIIGAGSWSVHINWTGAPGGTVLAPANGRFVISGLQFRDGLPGIWLDKHVNALGSDFRDRLSDVFFAKCTVAALKLSSITNCYLRDLRFAGVDGGYAIEVIHGPGASGGRPLVIRDSTFDTNGVTSMKGFLHVVMQDNVSRVKVVLDGWRQESTADAWVAPGGLVVLESSPANDLALVPADIDLRNLNIQFVANGMASLVHLETTQTTVAPNVSLSMIDKSGVVALASVAAGGAWSGGIPQMPDGTIRGPFTFGRQQSGATKKNVAHVRDLAIGGTGTTVIGEHISATATLDFPSIAAQTGQELTITATGAAAGDVCYASPSTTLEAGLVWSAWVSATNTVRIRLANVTVGAIDPASRSWRADVWKHV